MRVSRRQHREMQNAPSRELIHQTDDQDRRENERGNSSDNQQHRFKAGEVFGGSSKPAALRVHPVGVGPLLSSAISFGIVSHLLSRSAAKMALRPMECKERFVNRA